jgi:hypothetical protein
MRDSRRWFWTLAALVAIALLAVPMKSVVGFAAATAFSAIAGAIWLRMRHDDLSF